MCLMHSLGSISSSNLRQSRSPLNVVFVIYLRLSVRRIEKYIHVCMFYGNGGNTDRYNNKDLRVSNH